MGLSSLADSRSLLQPVHLWAELPAVLVRRLRPLRPGPQYSIVGPQRCHLSGNRFRVPIGQDQPGQLIADHATSWVLRPVDQFARVVSQVKELRLQTMIVDQLPLI